MTKKQQKKYVFEVILREVGFHLLRVVARSKEEAEERANQVELDYWDYSYPEIEGKYEVEKIGEACLGCGLTVDNCVCANKDAN